MNRGQLLKALGVAGMAGVAAGGVVVARQQRQRAALTPDEVRERLRERHEKARPVGPRTPPGAD